MVHLDVEFGTIINTTRDYDRGKGVLNEIQSSLLVNQRSELQDTRYSYDAALNLKVRHNRMRETRETFAYDALDRMTSHQGPNGTVTTTYDALGNIKSKSDVGSGNYIYDATRKRRLLRIASPLGAQKNPHFAVDYLLGAGERIQTPPQRLNTNFTYDAVGNMTQSGNRRMSWTAFSKPASIEKLGSANDVLNYSRFEYDADLNRSIKRSYDENQALVKETIYLGAYETSRTRAAGSESTTHRYRIATEAGTIQIEREHNTKRDKPTYLLSDHLGSTDVIVDAQGNVVQSQAYDAWGMRTTTADDSTGTEYTDNVNELTTEGYTGHEMDDEIGLINMNARLYDPYIGRFISADPVLPDPADLQAYNRYAYVLNNPMGFIDPTGNSRVGAFWASGGSLINSSGCIRSCGSSNPAQETGPKSASEPSDNVDGTGPDWNAAGEKISKNWLGSETGDLLSSRSDTDAGENSGVSDGVDTSLSIGEQIELDFDILVAEEAIQQAYNDGSLSGKYMFDSADDATRAVLEQAAPIGHEAGLELGGNLKQHWLTGKWKYTRPTVFGRHSGSLPLNNPGYHTHPSGSINFSNPGNNALGNSNVGDTSWVEQSGKTLYVGTVDHTGAVSIGACDPGVCVYNPDTNELPTPPSRIFQ